MSTGSMVARGALLGGRWVALPPDRVLRSPADLRRVVLEWAPATTLVDEAVASARAALCAWADADPAAREAALRAFVAELAADADTLAELVAIEVGKPITEARAEVASLTSKLEVTLDAVRVELARHDLPDGSGFWDWRPHGVFAVIGPFNFPLSLSHGHVVPALLCGNTVVLKPSESAPAVAERYAEAWRRAAERTGAPAGALTLLPGDGAVGAALCGHEGVDAIAFTGSYAVGTSILSANAARPGRLVALELGGKNASLVLDDADLDRAAEEIARAAFESTGQRCTATSRVLVAAPVLDAFVERLLAEAGRWRAGDPLLAATRMGPLTTASAQARFVAAQRDAAALGLETLAAGGEECDGPAPGYWVRPAIHRVVDADRARSRIREELFGPELLIESVSTDMEAVERAGATPYGLAAAVFTASRDRFDALRPRLRAGLVNWNRRTSGADGRLPFGGIGHSGNHRPAGALSVRYCVWPQATLLG